MKNKDTIAMSFNVQSQMNSKVAKPVGHIALSFSKEDEPHLTDRAMAGIALDYMERMGIRNTQYLIARHFDKEHPHVHIATTVSTMTAIPFQTGTNACAAPVSTRNLL